MKKILFLILVLLLLYTAFLLVPVGIFLFQASSLKFSDNVLYDQLTALSSVIVIENTAEAEPSPQTITITLTEEDLEHILIGAFRNKENKYIRVNFIRTEISPDLIEVDISYDYGWEDYHLFETTIFSQWLVDIFPPLSQKEKTRRIGIMPLEIHTNHLYSVNLAQLWPYLLKRVSFEEPWLIFPGEHQFQIEDMRLQEHKLSLSLAWDNSIQEY